MLNIHSLLKIRAHQIFQDLNNLGFIELLILLFFGRNEEVQDVLHNFKNRKVEKQSRGCLACRFSVLNRFRLVDRVPFCCNSGTIQDVFLYSPEFYIFLQRFNCLQTMTPV